MARYHRTLYAETNCDGGNLAQPGLDVVSMRGGSSPSALLGLTKSCLSLCQSVHYDVLVLQKPWLVTLPCALAAKAAGRKVVIDFDDVDSLWQTSPLKVHLARAGELVMPRLADLLTTHNDRLRRELRQRGYRVALVRQGVDTLCFDPARFDRAAERERLGLAKGHVFCFLGSFTAGSARDLSLILEAYRRVELARDDVSLLFIGGGGPLEARFREEIRRLGIERMRITGRLPQDEVPRYLCAADFGLVYMKDDAANQARVSFKVLEYLAMDLPVVGAVVGATADLLGGYVLDCTGGAAGLSQAMLRAIEGERRAAGRGHIVANYDWNSIGNELRGALEGVLGLR
jgi:glycosyltransferase involved in cell wall biosynthesis